MKVLHYFLGFPPYRTGGLTRYAFDLMQAQVKDGQTVMALWPGQIGILNHRTCIKKRKSVAGIKNFELINPLPVSLDEGIADVAAYMKPCDRKIYESFLEDIEPDAVHIHTLMGIHKEFIEAANKLNIRTIFTTHDYFGICPKVTLYRCGEVCEDDHGCRDCIQCNYSALSLKKIMIIQSPLYRNLKNSPVVRQLRKQHRRNFFDNEGLPEIIVVKDEMTSVEEKYRSLRTYYVYMLEHMNCIHFNSSVTEMVYRKYITPKSSEVITITHKNIADNRTTIKIRPSNKLRITSLAPAKPFKGFNILQAALDALWDDGNHDFELKLFSPVQFPRPYMIVKEGGFQQDELEEIFSETDVLVAPSIWYETFGFTVLEAISCGIPVIVSNHVGAKDIVGDGGIIIKAGSVQELKEAIKMLDGHKLARIRQNIMQMKPQKSWSQLVQENYMLYGGRC